MTGFREPAANGAMVRGTRATDNSLWECVSSGHLFLVPGSTNVPLERPVVAAVDGGWVRGLCGIVDGSSDDLWQRRKNGARLRSVEGSGGLDGGCDGSFPRDAGSSGGGDGGERSAGEDALGRGGSEGLAKDLGTESGGHCGRWDWCCSGGIERCFRSRTEQLAVN